jgi:hypothetical protein
LGHVGRLTLSAWHDAQSSDATYVELVEMTQLVAKTLEAPQKKTEAWVSASALNIMSNLRMPVSVKI